VKDHNSAYKFYIILLRIQKLQHDDSLGEGMFFFSMVFPAHSGPWPPIQFLDHFYTDGRTPWTTDQPVARSLPRYRTTQKQNKRIHRLNIDALSGIRTQIPASERAKTVHALDRAATVIGEGMFNIYDILPATNMVKIIKIVIK
jgi:hypothetical protein